MKFGAVQGIFSSRLLACMQACNMSQVELSRVTGLTPSTINRYLKGLRLPRIRELIMLALVFDVSVDWLLGIPDLKKDIEKTQNIFL